MLQVSCQSAPTFWIMHKVISSNSYWYCLLPSDLFVLNWLYNYRDIVFSRSLVLDGCSFQTQAITSPCHTKLCIVSSIYNSIYIYISIYAVIYTYCNVLLSFRCCPLLVCLTTIKKQLLPSIFILYSLYTNVWSLLVL
jgi:hypothetical protein